MTNFPIFPLSFFLFLSQAVCNCTVNLIIDFKRSSLIQTEHRADIDQTPKKRSFSIQFVLNEELMIKIELIQTPLT